MQGDNTLWQVGTDHAGISTQMVVERQLAAKILVAMISVANNLNNIFGIEAESGGHITAQMRRLGNSTDCCVNVTMDEDYQQR